MTPPGKARTITASDDNTYVACGEALTGDACRTSNGHGLHVWHPGSQDEGSSCVCGDRLWPFGPRLQTEDRS